MKTVLFVCVALLVGAFAAPSQDPKSIVTDVIRNVLEGARAKLAELHIDAIDVAGAHLANIDVSNADTFVIEALTAPNPLSFKVSNATLTLADASATFDFDFDNVEIPELGVTLTGSGSGNGAIAGGRVEITNAQLALHGLGVRLENFDSVSITVNSASLSMDGVDQGTSDALASYLPAFLNDKLPGLIQDNKQAIIDAVNEILANI